MTIEYCYSLDNELYNHESFGEMLDEISCHTDELLGSAYFRGEKVELTTSEFIDVDSFLEQCDERAYEEIGEVYDNCFQDVTPEEKKELHDLLVDWANKRVNMRFWKVTNAKEMQVTADDLTYMEI